MRCRDFLAKNLKKTLMKKFNKTQLDFIRSKFNSLNSKEIFNHLVVNFNFKLGYTTFRTECYKNGLYKCKMTRWSIAEKQYLLDNYKTMGNIEIAQNLSKNKRIFDTKKVQKQMRLSNLKRTKEELQTIIGNHKATGVYSKANYKRWEGVKCNEGYRTVQLLNNVPTVVIKINNIFIPYARQRYLELFGEIPKGYKVYLKDCNPMNVEDDNLIIQNTTLDKNQRELYKKNISKYFYEQKNTPKPTIKEVVKPVAQKVNLISIRINDKVKIQVKPGTDVSKIRAKYASALKNNWESSNQ